MEPVKCRNCSKEFTPRRYLKRAGEWITPKSCSNKCGNAAPEEKRFWQKVELIPFHACWEWVGGKDQWGYGRFWYQSALWAKKRLGRPHRFAYEYFKGAPVPDDLIILHRCDNPGCVNPDHLSVGTNKDNKDDCVRKGRFKPWGRVMKKDRALSSY